MKELISKRPLELMRKKATSQLKEAFVVFRSKTPGEEQIATYENTLTAFKVYASTFSQVKNTTNPFDHAVSKRNRIHEYTFPSDYFDTQKFFAFFKEFERVPFNGVFMSETIKRDRAKELAAFYFELALNARNGLFSPSRDFDTVAITDTFFARAREKYYEFEEYQFDIEMKKRNGYHVKNVSEILTTERNGRASHVASLYHPMTELWANTGASSHRDGHDKHVLLAELAYKDYDSMLKFDRGSGKKIYPPEQINLGFLR